MDGGLGGGIGWGGKRVDGSTGTGGGPTAILDVVPRSSDIPGWTTEPNHPTTAGQIAAVATNQAEAEI
jgi:hypothetical protein